MRVPRFLAGFVTGALVATVVGAALAATGDQYMTVSAMLGNTDGSFQRGYVALEDR